MNAKLDNVVIKPAGADAPRQKPNAIKKNQDISMQFFCNNEKFLPISRFVLIKITTVL